MVVRMLVLEESRRNRRRGRGRLSIDLVSEVFGDTTKYNLTKIWINVHIDKSAGHIDIKKESIRWHSELIQYSIV